MNKHHCTMKWKKSFDYLRKNGLTDCIESSKRFLKSIFLVTVLAVGISSCKKFLDVVPDNVVTVDHAFKLRNEAEKYLFTLYSYLPRSGDVWYNPGFMGGDEIWLPEESETHWHPIFRIARGLQNKETPYFDEWRGISKGNSNANDHRKIWQAIRQCNIFLENMRDMTKVPDITDSEREMWIGE